MLTKKEIEIELKRMLSKEYEETFCCVNNDAGCCLWQRKRGKECTENCERYNQCFSCIYIGKCHRISDGMSCGLDEKILPWSI